MKKTKVVIIEPSLIVSAGLKKLVESNADFSVLATLPCLSAYNEFQYGMADVMLVNVSLDRDGNIRSLLPTQNNTAFVAITYGPYDESVLKPYDGYVGLFHTEEQLLRRLRNAIEAVSDRPKVEASNELSPREKEILAAVAKGRSNKEIADEFSLSVYTVVSHRKNISHKLGINSIAGLTSYAIMNKLVDITDL
ncbi:MAG: response regulator transcription factor [Bacteroidales bacterium]|nr:response regulator transcription factor [Bacteroidales bacterium]